MRLRTPAVLQAHSVPMSLTTWNSSEKNHAYQFDTVCSYAFYNSFLTAPGNYLELMPSPHQFFSKTGYEVQSSNHRSLVVSAAAVT